MQWGRGKKRSDSFGGDSLEIVESVDAGVVPVGKMKLDSIASDGIPVGDRNPVEIATVIDFHHFIAEKIAFSLRFRAGGEGTKLVHLVIVLRSIFPPDGNFVPDELDIFDLCHSCAGPVARSGVGGNIDAKRLAILFNCAKNFPKPALLSGVG